jgi:hypothetical protein
MRIQLPDPDEMVQIRRRFGLTNRVFRQRGDQSTPFDGQAGTAALRGGQVNPALSLAPPDEVQDTESTITAETTTTGASRRTAYPAHHTPAAWNAEDHVEDYLQSQEREALFEVYTRAMLIVGVNQLLQALSYYLIGSIGKGSPTGALVCAVGIQGLAILLLLLDIDLGDPPEVSWPDINRAFFYHMLPPVIAAIVLILERVLSVHAIIIVATLSFVLHILWINCVLQEIAVTTANGKATVCSRFNFVRHMVDANRAMGAKTLGSDAVSLPWLVTKYFFTLILAMWVTTIAMNVAEVVVDFEMTVPEPRSNLLQTSFQPIAALQGPLRSGGFMIAG